VKEKLKKAQTQLASARQTVQDRDDELDDVNGVVDKLTGQVASLEARLKTATETGKDTSVEEALKRQVKPAHIGVVADKSPNPHAPPLTQLREAHAALATMKSSSVTANAEHSSQAVQLQQQLATKDQEVAQWQSKFEEVATTAKASEERIRALEQVGTQCPDSCGVLVTLNAAASTGSGTAACENCILPGAG